MILDAELNHKKQDLVEKSNPVNFDLIAPENAAHCCKIEASNFARQVPELKLIERNDQQTGVSGSVESSLSNATIKALAKAEKQWSEFSKTDQSLAAPDAKNAFKLEEAIIKGDAKAIQGIVEQYKDNVSRLKAVAEVSQQQLQTLNSQIAIDVPDSKKAIVLVHQQLNEGEDALALKVYGKQYDNGGASKPAPLIEMSSMFKMCGGEQFETYGTYFNKDVPQFMKELSKQVSSDINWTR